MKKYWLTIITAFSVSAAFYAGTNLISLHHRDKQLPVVIASSDRGVQIKKSKSKLKSDPSSIYMNALGYFADRDPQAQETAIQDYVIANFNSHNRVQWENTDTHDLFTLIKIDNPTYDNSGVIVSGDLIWGKQAFN